MALRLPDLEIVSVDGKWKRAENSECYRAVPFCRRPSVFAWMTVSLKGSRKRSGGWRADTSPIFSLSAAMRRGMRPPCSKRRKRIERSEPGSSPLAGSLPVKRLAMKRSRPHLHRQQREVRWGNGHRSSRPHVPASSCSSATVDEAIGEAKTVGLDGICLTDHNYVWDRNVVADLVKKHGFPVFRGNEITTDQGDVVVFGLEKDIKGVVKLEDLREEVIKVGGFIIAAHPFRGFLTFGVGRLGLTPEKAMERPLFKFVDGVEVMNSKVTQKENDFASKVTYRAPFARNGRERCPRITPRWGFTRPGFSRLVKDEKGSGRGAQARQLRTVGLQGRGKGRDGGACKGKLTGKN